MPIPTTYQAESDELSRRQAMANALMQQSLEPIQTQSVNGIPTPISPLQGLAKMFQGYQGNKLQQDVLSSQREFAKSNADSMNAMVKALYGGSDNSGSQQDTTVPQKNTDANAVYDSQSPPRLVQPTASAAATRSTKPNPQMLAMLLMADAAGKGSPAQMEIAKAFLESNKGIAQRPGAPVVNPYTGEVIAQPTPSVPQGVGLNVGPDGPQAFAVPGANQAMANAAAATAGGTEYGKFPYHEVTTASGAKMPAFAAGVNAPPLPGSIPNPAAPTAATTPVPSAAPQPMPAPNPGITPPAPRPPIATPQDQVQPVGSADPWATMPKRPIPQGIGQSTYNESMSKNYATQASELSTKYGTQATEAGQRLAFNNQALSLINSADTGPQAANIAQVKNWLTSRFDIPESSFENTPSATVALQKDLVNAATQKAKQQFGARMTQSEVMLMLSKASPNVDMPKAAMTYLLQSDIAQLNHQLKQSNDLGKYLQAGGDPTRFESWYSNSFPMTNDLGAVHLGNQKQSSQPNPAIDELLKKYGATR